MSTDHSPAGPLTATPWLAPCPDDTPAPATLRQTKRPHDRYDLRERIAQGGVGVIYGAWDRVLERVVAVKLLLAENPSADMLRRFSDEAHALAQLAHPNIPPIYDRGTLDVQPEFVGIPPAGIPTVDSPGPFRSGAGGRTGRPFIALKLIQGDTLANLLAKDGPGSSRWLAVFESLCQAVGYAHERGYAHRDLKPANVMVGAFGEVQVMDWGLAKKLPTATTADGTPKRLTRDVPSPSPDQTFFGTVMGTPSYMAPEQARGDTDRIGRRSDVFALGAILCELLTGRTPITGTTTQILDRCVLGEFDDGLATLDASGEDPALVALAKHCLAFRPIDRPADGRAVAAAVAAIRSDAERRAKDGELLRARDESRQGEQRKRRRIQTVAAAALIATLTAGTVTATVLAAKANDAATAERLMNDRLRAGLRESEASQDVLFDVFKDLDVRDTRQGSESLEVRLGKRLAASAAKFEPSPERDPAALARLQYRLGVTVLHFGDAKVAAGLLRHAADAQTRYLGPNHRETLATQNRLAEATNEVSRRADGLSAIDDIIDRCSRHLGPDDEVTLSAKINRLSSLAYLKRTEEAIPYGEAVAAEVYRKYGPEHEESVTVRNNLAMTYDAANRRDKAIPLMLENLPILERRFGPDHPFTIISLANLATAHSKDGDRDRAMLRWEESARRARQKLHPGHNVRVSVVRHLAWEYYNRQRWSESAELFREVTQITSDRSGPDHDDTAISRAMTADSLRRANRPAEAIREYEGLWAHWNRWEAKTNVVPHDLTNFAACLATVGNYRDAACVAENVLRRRTKLSGPDHDDTLAALRTLADYYRLAAQVPEATAALERLLVPVTRKKGATHADTLVARNILGDMYRESGRIRDAIAFHEDTLSATTSLPPNDLNRLVCRNNLGTALQSAGRYDEARFHLRTVYDGFRASNPPHAYVVCCAGQNLAKNLYLGGRRKDAESLFDSLLADYRAGPSPPDVQFGLAWSAAALFLLDHGQFARAEAFAREAKTIRDVAQPDAWTTYNTRTLLGRALLKQGKYAEAESELVPGFQGLVRHVGAIPAPFRFYVHDAGNALTDLYRETNRPQLIPAVRAKLPREQAPSPVPATDR